MPRRFKRLMGLFHPRTGPFCHRIPGRLPARSAPARSFLEKNLDFLRPCSCGDWDEKPPPISSRCIYKIANLRHSVSEWQAKREGIWGPCEQDCIHTCDLSARLRRCDESRVNPACGRWTSGGDGRRFGRALASVTAATPEIGCGCWSGGALFGRRVVRAVEPDRPVRRGGAGASSQGIRPPGIARPSDAGWQRGPGPADRSETAAARIAGPRSDPNRARHARGEGAWSLLSDMTRWTQT
jgi:hypothetical protein